MQHFNNTFIKSDKKFHVIIYGFLKKSEKEYTMIVIYKSLNLSKTLIMLSLSQLTTENKVEISTKKLVDIPKDFIL